MIPKANVPRFFAKALRQPFYALKVGWKRFKAYRAYKRRDGFAPPPEAITFFLTYLCNLRCKMCGQWGESGVTRRKSEGGSRRADLAENIKIGEYRKIIEDIASFKPNITLFGGEPLLYKDVIELIGELKRRKLHVLMITNGSLLEKFAEELVSVKIDEINLSLDGDEKLHDEIRGLPGLFRKITAGVKKVQMIKKREKRKKPLINLQTTITKWNYTKLEKLLAVGEELSVDSLTFHNLIYLTEDIYRKQEEEFGKDFNASSADWAGFVFSPDIDGKVLTEKIRQIKNTRKKFPVDFYPAFPESEIQEYYSNPYFQSRSFSPFCLSPWICSYIFPDGSIKPCLNLDYSFGNVKRDAFLKIWNGERAVRFRRRLIERKNYPACFRCTEFYRY